MPPLMTERIAHLARVAARGFNRALQVRLADMDMSFGQWIFLRLLWVEDGLPQGELGARAQVTGPTAHTALVGLEKLGYVERRKRPGDSRRLYVFLTDRGRALKEVLEPLAIEVNERATEGMSAAEIDGLRKALILLIENLDADEKAAAAEGRHIPPTRRKRRA
jgi:DNA-binding MarR family transcriptional regulator